MLQQKNEFNWTIVSPDLGHLLEPADELAPLKDLINKARFMSKFRVRRRGRGRVNQSGTLEPPRKRIVL